MAGGERCVSDPIDPTYSDVLLARTRIAPYVRQTPVLGDESRLPGLSFKCENLQAVEIGRAHV